jgi:hypothetical protein
LSRLIMRNALQTIAFTIAWAVLVGCSERERLGSGYVLVSPPAMGPDHHPGTSLHRKGKVAWGNVYIGYFSPHDASKFFHDGIFVFVGPLPGDTDWWTYSQLFGVRGGDIPVVLSERLLRQRLVVSSDMREMSTFAVRHITPAEGGLRVEFEYRAGSNVTKTNDLTWAEIKRLLDEADTSAKIVHHRLGDYRVLPLQ